MILDLILSLAHLISNSLVLKVMHHILLSFVSYRVNNFVFDYLFVFLFQILQQVVFFAFYGVVLILRYFLQYNSFFLLSFLSAFQEIGRASCRDSMFIC